MSKATALLLLVGAALASWAVASSAPAAPSRLSLDPPVPALGERARLSVQPSAGDSLPRPQGRNVAVLPTDDPHRFTVVPLQVGMAEIFLPGGGDTLRFVVPSTLDPDSLPSPRPLHGVGILGPVWWPTILLALAIVLPPLILLVVWLRRRRRQPVAPAFTLVAEAAHRVALQRLQEIEDAGWIERGEIERFHVEASRVLRAYVAGRYRVPALDWTRQELAERLEAAGYEGETFIPLLELLEEADTVKFAGARPTQEQARRWLERARDWIHTTKVELVYTTADSVDALRRLQEAGA